MKEREERKGDYRGIVCKDWMEVKRVKRERRGKDFKNSLNKT